MRLTIKQIQGKELVLDVRPTARIPEVKIAIAEKTGIPVANQRLLFAGKQLEDEHACQDYSIQDRSTLYVFERPAQVAPATDHGNFISIKTLTEKVFTIQVELTDRIEDLKTKIQDQEFIPPDQQRLVYGGQTLEDGNTLGDYLIPFGAQLGLVMRFGG
jgi:ubiquitin C